MEAEGLLPPIHRVPLSAYYLLAWSVNLPVEFWCGKAPRALGRFGRVGWAETLYPPARTEEDAGSIHEVDNERRRT